ncbi:DUF6011 domain-containing protein [Nocardiopsis gilva]|uniref:DUF6011 domain-containing protein n=1 Tax=Nocardiopsis gilva TaxID=280236 RepID=UPI00373AF42A
MTPRCGACRRPLKCPASIAAGTGPVCRRRRTPQPQHKANPSRGTRPGEGQLDLLEDTRCQPSDSSPAPPPPSAA